ncbi:hypothetical protein AAKU55_000570 [Oxalobacteraceae bacterium GrIS 1.11]
MNQDHLLPAATPNDSAPSPEAADGGEILAAMYGGGDFYYRRPAQELLVNAGASRRVLLHHSAKSLHDHRREVSSAAWTNALFWAPVPVFWVVGSYVAAFHAPPAIALIGTALACLMIGRRTVRNRNRDTVNWGWEVRKWIDLDERTFVIQFNSFGKCPEQRTSTRSIEDLMLLAEVNTYWESDSSDDLVLVDREAYQRSLTSHEPCHVCQLHLGEGIPTIRLGEALERLWKIPFVNRLS